MRLAVLTLFALLALAVPAAHGKPNVVLGLEEENFALLKEGKPIRVNLHNLDPDGPPTDLPDITVMIAAVDTDDWRQFVSRLNTSEDT